MYQEIKDQVTTTLHKACVIAVGGAVNQLCTIEVPRQQSADINTTAKFRVARA